MEEDYSRLYGVDITGITESLHSNMVKARTYNSLLLNFPSHLSTGFPVLSKSLSNTQFKEGPWERTCSIKTQCHCIRY